MKHSTHHMISGLYPKFWYKKNSIISLSLLPFSYIYSFFFSLLIKQKGQTVACPVICVGNITTGGTGKSPLVNEIAVEAKNQGYKVAILLLGYGRKLRSVLQVDVSKHKVAQVGDEALCHAKNFTVWVAPKRNDAAKVAIKEGANFLIMDDGLQHRHLHKDVSILLLPTMDSLGNLRQFPAGPLREDSKKVWPRVDVCLHEGELSIAIPSYWSGSIGCILPLVNTKETRKYKWLDRPVVAFCGIARPHRFFNYLQNIGAKISSKYSFPDHCYYDSETLDFLLNMAKVNNAQLVSTQKDCVRLPDNFKKHVVALPFRIKVKPIKLIPDMIKLAKLRYMVRSSINS